MGLSKRNRRALAALILLCLFGFFEIKWLQQQRIEREQHERFQQSRSFRQNRPPRPQPYQLPLPIEDFKTPRLNVYLDETAVQFTVEPLKVSEGKPSASVFISEIHYHPAGNSESIEFVEISNAMKESVTLDGWEFSKGIDFKFDSSSMQVMPPGETWILCRNLQAFTNEFGNKVKIVGVYQGGLRNSGERIRLVDSENRMVDEVFYRDLPPWPASTDGNGRSLNRNTPRGPGDDPTNWSAQTPNPGNYEPAALESTIPWIHKVKHLPKSPNSKESIRITAVIQNALTVHQLKLHLSIDSNEYVFPANLELSGDHKTYQASAEIPPLPDSTLIRYWFSITANDESITRFPAAELPTPNFACYVRDKNINTKLPAYSLLLKKEDLQNMHYYPRENQTYPATFIFKGKVYDHVRIRIRGAYARSWPKKAYKIFFNKDRLFKNRSRLNLNSGWKDPAMIREVLSYYIYHQSGAYSLKSQPVRFEINGSFWGMFIEVEQPEKHYLSDAGLKGAVLYKADSRRNEADERDHGLALNYQRHYQKETHEKEPYDDLANFCEELRKHRDSLEFFSSRFDLSKYINFLCATALTQNWDSFNKNHFIGKTRDGSGKWFILPWDLDRTLGDHWNWSFDEFQLPSTLGTQFDPGPTGWNRLADRFFRNAVLQKQFDKRLMELLHTEFTEAKMSDWIDGMKEQISKEAEADQKKWGNQGYWKTEMENLKNTIKNRHSFLLEELKSRGLENKIESI